MSKIGIIVPVYKVELYLNRCVDSILNQSFSDFELILVDDGSPDDSGRICDEYAEKDDRIVVIHKENGGLSDARNAGINWVGANSNCDWITFIDSDDWVHPQYLELLLNSAEENDVRVSCCGHYKTNSKLKTLDFNDKKPVVFSAQQAYKENVYWFYSAWGKMFKRDLFDDKRFPKGRLYEDGALITEILFGVKQFAFFESKLYYYYINPNSITNVVKTKKHLQDHNLAFLDQMDFFYKNNYLSELNIAIKRGFKKLQYEMYSYKNDHELLSVLRGEKSKIYQKLISYGFTYYQINKLYSICLKETREMIIDGISADYYSEDNGFLRAILFRMKNLLSLLFFRW